MRAGYKQTEIGVLPADWRVEPLSAVADVRGGIAKNSNVVVADPITVHYLRVANVQDGYLQLAEMSQIQISRQDLKRYSVLPGDVLMNEGGDLDKLGRGAVWRGEYETCVHQNHVFVVRCKAGLLPEYLNLWTAASPARKFFLLAGKQTTNLASISKSSLGELSVAVPPPAEQEAISAALCDVDALLNGLDRLIAKKRDLKQAAMQQLLTGQTRLPGFTTSWELRRLGDLCDIGMGSTPPRLTPAYWGKGFKWLSIADLKSKVVSESKEEITELAASMMPIIPKGTLLMSFKLSIGRLCFAGCDLFTNEAICSFNGLKANPEFLYYTLKTTDFALYGKQAVKGFTLNKQSLNLVEVQLPDSNEQSAIAKVLSEMDAELTTLEARRTKTQALKQAMMQELLTGNTRLV